MSSHEFDNAFCEHNSPEGFCQFCGTIEFSHESERFEELLEKSKTDAKVRHNAMDDSIGWGYIDGKQYVYQCKCKKVDHIENWIWEHKEQIANYLVARARKEATEASNQLSEMLPLTTVDFGN